MSEQPKKKGVKLGTKRGSYKKTTVNLSSDQTVNETFERLSKDLKEQKEFNDQLISEINEAKMELANIKNSVPDPIPAIPAPKFIFDPSPVFTAMNRVIAYEIKEGNLKRDAEILQNFTVAAIKYYIRNEFNHILK